MCAGRPPASPTPRRAARSAPGSRPRRRGWRGATSPPPSTPTASKPTPNRLSVEIAGELVTWIGREESSRNDRRYRLAFRIDGGRIGLLRFEEMED